MGRQERLKEWKDLGWTPRIFDPKEYVLAYTDWGLTEYYNVNVNLMLNPDVDPQRITTQVLRILKSRVSAEASKQLLKAKRRL